MTTVRIWSTTIAEYILIKGVSIGINCSKKPAAEFADPPLTDSDWGTTQTRKFLDLVDYKRTFTISGYINTNSEYTSTTWSTLVSNADVFPVRDSLTELMSYGGVINFTIGTTTDGYSATYNYTGFISKIDFTQKAEDIKVATKLGVSITIEEGANL